VVARRRPDTESTLTGRMSPSQTTTTPPASPWPLPQRMAWLKRFTGLIVKHEQTLTTAITADTKKPDWQALTGDVLTLLMACRWHAKHARKLLSPRSISRDWFFFPGTTVKLHRIPMGNVLLIATWNYPVQLLGIQLVQALLAGNRVTVKPSEKSPASQALLLKLALEAGLPEGQLTIAPATREAGPALLAQGCNNKPWDHIIFTGSTVVGRSIARHAAEHLISTTLELSGNDSAIVLPDADIDLAARVIHAAFTLNSGQTCLAPRRVIAIGTAAQTLLPKLKSLIDQTPALPLIDEHAVARLQQLDPTSSPATSTTFKPRLVENPPLDSNLLTCQTADHFGPMLAFVSAPDISSALRIHHSCSQHLSVALFTRDTSLARSLIPQLSASVVMLNDAVFPAGHPAIGITGHGPSGWGTSRGELGLLALTRPVYLTHTTFPRIPLGPLKPNMLTWLRRGMPWLFAKPPR
jgi:acyl-CoA reductase-like NAD-dependent aldehyde dehydrogenase